MINNPELINKVISQIKSLTYEQITEVIRKVDMEEDIKKINDYIHDWYDNSTDEDGYDRYIIDEDDKNFINAIENILNRLQEDEAVIKEILEEYVFENGINVKNFCDEEIRTNNCIQDCIPCIEQYFRNKI